MPIKTTLIIYEHKTSSFEFGTSLILRKERFFTELSLSSYPEYDHILKWGNPSEYYRVKAFYLPYVSLGFNILLDDQKSLDILKDSYSHDEYLKKQRKFRVESGLFNILPSVGISYESLLKNYPKAKFEVGLRYASLTDFFTAADLYYGYKYNIKSSIKHYYKLNLGFELGGGILTDNNTFIIPFPWVYGFIENEFTRFYIKSGIGVGAYILLGYKL